MEFSSLIKSGLESLHIAYSAHQLWLLSRYANNMLEHGEERGLTSLKDPEIIARELVIDAVGGVAVLQAADSIADLGSGGGTPGLPLAIMLENTSFTLVESNQRKARWIAEQIQDLALGERVRVVSTRIEELGRDEEYRQKYDFVVAKALAALPALIELSLPLLKIGGKLVAYKGSKFVQEIQDSSKALKELRCQVCDITHYDLGGMDRVLVQIVKQQATPNIYPRRTGLPQHSPLVYKNK